MSRELHRTKVALFCGGRGSQTLIREFLRWPDIELTLLVNAYDDGLSTGALRALIPGMLGPSDFRKNLSYLLGLYSAPQYALQNLIEYRFPLDFGKTGKEALERYALRNDLSGMPEAFRKIYAEIDAEKRTRIERYIKVFIEYYNTKGAPEFDFGDCSFGNLIFAGIYLTEGESFNRTAQAFGDLVSSEARLLNVSEGENRTLAALKEDGEILSRESQVVGKQSPVKIADIFFTEGPIPADVIARLADKSMDEKRAWFAANALNVVLSKEARAAIESADAIVFGPGTQHSSLFPSYIMAGEAVSAAPAKVKAIVSNLHFDHDINGYTVNDLVGRALHYLGDPDNRRRTITHALYAEQAAPQPDSVLLDESLLRADGTVNGAIVSRGPFQNPNFPGMHSGHAIVRRIRDLVRHGGLDMPQRTIRIFSDLYKRSIFVDAMLQEFLEIDWTRDHSRVTLQLNRSPVPKMKSPLPEGIAVEASDLHATEPEVEELQRWLKEGTSEFLVTLTGDGEYRVRDVLPAISVLNNSSFGVVFGSRSQSRQQLRRSLGDAYGDTTFVRLLSLFGAFSVSALFFLRHRVVFSDPMTGFRIYQRSKLPAAFRTAVQQSEKNTTTRITNLLLRHGVEIGEIPVSYRTFPSFTDFRWRLERGLRNLGGLLG